MPFHFNFSDIYLNFSHGQTRILRFSGSTITHHIKFIVLCLCLDYYRSGCGLKPRSFCGYTSFVYNKQSYPYTQIHIQVYISAKYNERHRAIFQIFFHAILNITLYVPRTSAFFFFLIFRYI